MTLSSSDISRTFQIDGDARVLVGYSGGADSSALLHLLVSQLGRERVFALHVNHNIRGAEALRDRDFCRSTAIKYGIVFACAEIDAPALSRASGKSVEEVSRDARYSLFGEYAGKYNCRFVALAHNLDDCAETFLINLARGSGAGGLGGIPVSRPLGKSGITVIRPLLGDEKKDIIAYCEKHSVGYVTDSTNLTSEYTRNKIRLGVIPALEEINSAFKRHCAAASELISADDSYLVSLASEEYRKRMRGNALFTVGLSSLAYPIASRVLMLYLEENGSPLSAANVRALLSVIDSPSAELSLGNSRRAIKKYDLLTIETERPRSTDKADRVPTFAPFGLCVGENVIQEAGLRLFVEEISPPFDIKDASGDVIYFDSGRVNNEITVRPRKEGDIFEAPAFSITLKKLFINRKIPKTERELVPVFVDGDRVIALPGEGCSAGYRICSLTQKAIRIIIDKKN